MERAVIVRGQLTDDRHIELDEPVQDVSGAVEVTVRQVSPSVTTEEDILDFLRRVPRGTRTKAEIDGYIQTERDSWDRPEGWPWRQDK